MLMIRPKDKKPIPRIKETYLNADIGWQLYISWRFKEKIRLPFLLNVIRMVFFIE